MNGTARPPSATSCMRTAIELETRAGELYARMAGRLDLDPRTAALLRDLAAEERQHALRIGLVLRHHPGMDWEPEPIARACDDLREGIETVAAIASRVDATEELRAVDALLVVVEVEKMFESVHVELVDEAAHPEARALFRSLAAQDAAHRRLARETAARLAADAPASGSP